MERFLYEQIIQELAESGSSKRYINKRVTCRYCGTADSAAFGGRDNAHAFPAALGNRVLFALDECKACNGKFSIYEDALSKAIGPFLTLGGVRGRKGVRQTGRSVSKSKIQHSSNEERRRLSITSEGNPKDLVSIDPSTGIMKLRTAVSGV